MRTLSTPEPPPKTKPAEAPPVAVRSDASIRDSVRVLAEIVTQLSERIEILEARELLRQPR